MSIILFTNEFWFWKKYITIYDINEELTLSGYFISFRPPPEIIKNTVSFLIFSRGSYNLLIKWWIIEHHLNIVQFY